MKISAVDVNVKFGRLTVQSIHSIRIFSDKNKAKYWTCICDCGQSAVVLGSHLSSGHTKSCGCLMIETSRANAKSITRKRGPIHGSKLAFDAYKSRAKKKKRDFFLTMEQFKELTSQNCFYCEKIPMQNSKGKYYGKNYTYNGLDRKDNALGYTLENVVPCCISCNKIKGNNLTFDEYVFVAKQLKAFRGL